MIRTLKGLVACLVALLGAGILRAHSAPGSAVLLDFHSGSVAAELRLPISELRHGVRLDLESEPATVVERFGPQLTEYLQRHVALSAPDGRVWTVEIERLEMALNEQPIDLVAHTVWRPPAGAPLRQFTLRYDVISHEVMNHMVVVAVRSDWEAALLNGDPELLGTLRSFAPKLAVDRAAGSAWAGFRSVFKLGAHHIAEGADHLLFLLVLLLAAPLRAENGKWRGSGGVRHSVLGLLKIVTAFTVGHSVTLISAALGWLRLPSAPVEVAIAGSILVSAVHAFRPIFPGREPVIAGVFGLVHGLAFATVLAEFRLDAWHLGSALLAFNLGIECLQLMVVVIVVPWLVVLSSTSAYAWLRSGGATFASFAAIGWVGERALGWGNPMAGCVDFVAAHAGWGVGMLAVAAATITIWRRCRAAGEPVLLPEVN